MTLTARTGGLTLVAMLAFAANSLLCRAALDGGFSDAATFTTLRLVGGAFALGLLVQVRTRTGRRRETSSSGWRAPVALFVYATGFSLAYLRIPAGVGALLLIVAVQVTMLAGGWRGGERLTPREWMGQALSLVGLVALTRPGLAQPDPIGAGVMIGAGVAWGIYSLLGLGAGDPLSVNASHFARSVPLALLGSAVGIAVASPHLTPLGAGLALTSGALTSGVGYVVWYSALRGLSAAQAAIVQLSVPPLTAAGGILLLGEAVTPRLVGAGLLILGGIALAVAGRGRGAATGPPSIRGS